MFFIILGLMIVGLLLVFCEVFVPGGIIGGIGFVMMIVSVWLCFHEYGVTTGLFALLGCLLATIAVALTAFELFPRTHFGRWMIMKDSMQKDQGYHSDYYTSKNMMGKEGITESELRPSGIAIFDGERYDVVSDAEFLEPRTRVKVIKSDGNRLVVERF